MPRLRLSLNNPYLIALKFTFLISVTLAPICIHLVSQAVQRHMPANYTFNPSFLDIVKFLALLTTIIALSVSIALVLQYHWLVTILQFKVDCTSTASQASVPVRPTTLGIPSRSQPSSESHTTGPGFVNPSDSQALSDTPAISQDHAKRRPARETPTLI